MNEKQNRKLKYHLNHLYIIFFPVFYLYTVSPTGRLFLFFFVVFFLFCFLLQLLRKAWISPKPPIGSWNRPSSSDLRVFGSPFSLSSPRRHARRYALQPVLDVSWVRSARHKVTRPMHSPMPPHASEYELCTLSLSFFSLTPSTSSKL